MKAKNFNIGDVLLIEMTNINNAHSFGYKLKVVTGFNSNGTPIIDFVKIDFVEDEAEAINKYKEGK